MRRIFVKSGLHSTKLDKEYTYSSVTRCGISEGRGTVENSRYWKPDGY
jgi:hypothetical protein